MANNEYTITHNLSKLTKGNITLNISPETNYDYPLSSNNITITNGSIVSYNNSTGILVINGDDTTQISFECPRRYTITKSGTNCTLTGQNYIRTGEVVTINITPNSGYNLPSSVSVSGASYSYSNGIITLSNPTSNVSISVTCISQTFTVIFRRADTNDGSGSQVSIIPSGQSASILYYDDSVSYQLSSSTTFTIRFEATGYIETMLAYIDNSLVATLTNQSYSTTRTYSSESIVDISYVKQ